MKKNTKSSSESEMVEMVKCGIALTLMGIVCLSFMAWFNIMIYDFSIIALNEYGMISYIGVLFTLIMLDVSVLGYANKVRGRFTSYLNKISKK